MYYFLQLNLSFLVSQEVLIILQPVTQQTFVGLEDVFNTSSRHAFKTSSTRLRRNSFTSSKTSWRRLEYVLRTSCKDVLKTSWRRLEDLLQDEKLLCWRCLEDMSWSRLQDVLKTCLEDLLKILWRQTKYLLGISEYISWDLTNLNVYLTSLYFTNLYLTTLKQIQNALITGDWFGVMKLA